jgi:hypothetical protein
MHLKQQASMHPEITAHVAVGVGTLVLLSAAARAWAWRRLQSGAFQYFIPGTVEPWQRSTEEEPILQLTSAALFNIKNHIPLLRSDRN